MKTVLFFDRCELTELYIQVSRLMNDVKIIHVAYSKYEEKLLNNSGLNADYVYLDIFREYYDGVVLNHEILSQIDNDIITYSKQRFNLNSSIQSDRGFSLLNYDECLRSAVAHYKSWAHIFNSYHVDLLLHEPCSLFFNHIAAILCKKQGGLYNYHIQVESENDDFAYLNAIDDDYNFYELHYLYKKYKDNPNLIDIKRCKHFLEGFRNNHNVFMGGIINVKKPFLRFLMSALRIDFLNHIRPCRYDRVYENIDYWLSKRNSPKIKVTNLIGYKRQKVCFEDKIPSGEKFFFYPMHLEPEAVVLYLGDGIYNNQIKLIENIAASLPVGYYLYVKDHPHQYAYRAPEDYKRLMNIPNIRLLNQWIPAQELIRKSEGVITINGTAGFEALLQGKKVFCFGKNQYSFAPRVHYIENIRDFRGVVYNNIKQSYNGDDDLYPYIMAFLESSYKGYVNYFMGTADVARFNKDENAQLMADGIEKYVNSDIMLQK